MTDTQQQSHLLKKRNYSNEIIIRNTIFFAALLFSNGIMAIEKQLVMGAGPSTAVATLFFEHFSKTAAAKEYTFEVEQRSIKHAGGILASDKYIFGRTGRPLNKKEKSLNKEEIYIARIPLSIVIGDQTGVKSISLEQLEKIFTGKIIRWNQLGGANHQIIVIGREKTEAAFDVLKKKYNFFSKAYFEKIFTRDHQVANFLKSKKGAYAISFGAGSNFDERYHLNVNEFEAGVNLGLVYDTANSSHPLVESARAFAKSKTWIDIVRHNDFLPPGTN